MLHLHFLCTLKLPLLKFVKIAKIDTNVINQNNSDKRTEGVNACGETRNAKHEDRGRAGYLCSACRSEEHWDWVM
jgi:hypothetical protein